MVRSRGGQKNKQCGKRSTNRVLIQNDPKKTCPRGHYFALRRYSHVRRRAPPRTLTRTARERTSSFAAMRGLACNSTREVRPRGREGAFSEPCEVLQCA
jgi:hypothetical protein